MTMTPESTATKLSQVNATQTETIEAVIDGVSSVLLGKDKQIRLALACLFANGHLLIEDLPGMGKTLLSHTLAHSARNHRSQRVCVYQCQKLAKNVVGHGVPKQRRWARLDGRVYSVADE